MKDVNATSTPELSVIVPNFNDAESIIPFLAEIETALEARSDYSYEIIVVDDGSMDKSISLLRAAANDDVRIKVVELTRNFGQQAALYVGLTCAAGSIVVTIDGDGQYPAKTIPVLADAIRDGNEMASGNRIDRRDKIFSKFTSKVGAILIREVLKMDISDIGSVKAFSRKLVNRITDVQIGGMPDVYLSALSRRPRLKEVDIDHRPREHGHSKWSLTLRIKVYFDLYMKYSDDQFGIIFKMGLFLTAGSVVGTLFLLLYKALLGHQESFLMILALGAIFVTVGLQFTMWSFIASALKQTLRRDTLGHSEFVREIYSTSTAEQGGAENTSA